MNNFVRRWNEFVLITLMVIAWEPSCWLIRTISGDVTAFTFDAGVLHTLYVTMLSIAAIWLFTYVGLRLNWPLFWRYNEGLITEELESDFKALTPKERIWLFVVFYLGLLLFAAIIFLAVAGLA